MSSSFSDNSDNVFSLNDNNTSSSSIDYQIMTDDGDSGVSDGISLMSNNNSTDIFGPLRDPPSSGVFLTVVIIPVITGSISFLSSLYLLYQISKSIKLGKARPKDHLLLGLSFLDACGSFGFLFSTFPAPAELQSRYNTYGTVGTCTAQGFFVHFGLGVPLYNAGLCLYYLLAIRYNVSDQILKKWLIPTIHIIALTFVVGTSIFGLIIKVFNFAGAMGCWASRVHPNECEHAPETCDRASRDVAIFFSFYFGTLPVSLSGLIVVCCMVILYCTVRNIEKRSKQWDPEIRYERRNSNGGGSVSSQGGNSIGGSVQLSASARTNLSTHAQEVSFFGNTFPNQQQHPKYPKQQQQQQQQPRRGKKKRTMSRKTMETGLYYSLSFLLVYLPGAILQTPGRQSAGYYETLLIANAICLPLQGFFNLLVYTASRSKKKRKHRRGTGGIGGADASGAWSSTGTGNSGSNRHNHYYHHGRNSFHHNGPYNSSTRRNYSLQNEASTYQQEDTSASMRLDNSNRYRQFGSGGTTATTTAGGDVPTMIEKIEEMEDYDSDIEDDPNHGSTNKIRSQQHRHDNSKVDNTNMKKNNEDVDDTETDTEELNFFTPSFYENSLQDDSHNSRHNNRVCDDTKNLSIVNKDGNGNNDDDDDDDDRQYHDVIMIIDDNDEDEINIEIGKPKRNRHEQPIAISPMTDNTTLAATTPAATATATAPLDVDEDVNDDNNNTTVRRKNSLLDTFRSTSIGKLFGKKRKSQQQEEEEQQQHEEENNEVEEGRRQQQKRYDHHQHHRQDEDDVDTENEFLSKQQRKNKGRRRGRRREEEGEEGKEEDQRPSTALRRASDLVPNWYEGESESEEMMLHQSY